MDANHLKLLAPGIEKFNQQEYWDCHEVLEDPWYELTGDPDRYVYWAIIQVATALFHIQNDNIVGARGMIAKAKDKMQKIDSANNDFLNHYLSWRQLRLYIDELPENPEAEQFNNLMNFRFDRFPSSDELKE
jgi:predicted metal-dependent hydrolase